MFEALLAAYAAAGLMFNRPVSRSDILKVS
jgi:hypothetical protein